MFAEQSAAGRSALSQESLTIRDVSESFSVDMQFIGQSHVVRVERDLQEKFEAVYWDRFKVELEEIRARVVNLNCSVVGVSDPVDISALIDPAGRLAKQTPSGSRTVIFDDGAVETPVYWRDHLPLNARIEGPAIIEQMDTTVLLEPGWVASGDDFGNLILEEA